MGAAAMAGTSEQRQWVIRVLGYDPQQRAAVASPIAEGNSNIGPSESMAGQGAASAVPETPEPFQLFVKSVDNITLTLRLPNGPATTLGELRGLVEGRAGVSLDEHSLMIGTKPFRAAHAGLAITEYGVQPNQTLFLQGALKGGFGERAAVADVILRGIQAGNVVSDIVKTNGESRAKAAFGRYMLQEDKRKGMEKEAALARNFRVALFKKMEQGRLLPNGVNSEAKLETWMKDNTTFLSAIACSRLQAGTCADYANQVYTSLISNTKNQTVYRAGMGGGRDHAFVITSPTDHGDDFEKLYNDPNAMVVDAWFENTICSFKKFADGENPYGEQLDANKGAKDLAMRRHETASGKPPLSKEFENAMNSVIDDFVKEDSNQKWLAARTQKFKQNADEIVAAEALVQQRRGELDQWRQELADHLKDESISAEVRRMNRDNYYKAKIQEAAQNLAAAKEAWRDVKGDLLFGSAGDPWERDSPRDLRTEDDAFAAFALALKNGGIKQLEAEMDSLTDTDFLLVCKQMDKQEFKKYVMGVSNKIWNRYVRLDTAAKKAQQAQAARAQVQQAQAPQPQGQTQPVQVAQAALAQAAQPQPAQVR
jgi:hypothetical protein